jgi:hypothetical protein
MMPTTDDVDLYSVQHLAALLWMRPYTAIAMTKMLRELLLVCGQDAIVHNWQFLAFTAVMDQFMQGWFYTAFASQPFLSLVPKDQWRCNDGEYIFSAMEKGVLIDELDDVVMEPTKSDQVITGFFYGCRTAAALATAYVTNALLSFYQEDKEALDPYTYAGCIFTIYLISMLTERLLQEGMARFSPRLFEFRHRQRDNITIDPSVLDLLDQDAIDTIPVVIL